MLEFPAHDVRPDEEFAVRVRAEACAALDAVFVYHAQGAEGLVLWGVVGGEGEGVEGVEPAVVGVAAEVPGSFLDAEVGGWWFGGHCCGCGCAFGCC